MSLADIVSSPTFIAALAIAAILCGMWISYTEGYNKGCKVTNTVWREHNKRCRQQRYNTLMDSDVQDKFSEIFSELEDSK